MSYDVIVRFPSKEMADYWCGQMSDGFGEGWNVFDFWRQLDGTDGTKSEHYERVVEDGKPVFFVHSVQDFEDDDE